MRVFLDANILFSAAKADGAIRRMLGLLGAAGHELWVDAYVVEEARRNLGVVGPEAVATLQTLLRRLRAAEASTAPTGLPRAVRLAEKDRPVLAAAIRLRCDALVTGDRTHFGALYDTTVLGVAIHSPRSLAASLLP